MQVVRRSSFTTTPWKNGGGITHEAIRMPPGGGPFRWRVSVAEIHESGPFSDFAGYDRKMLLLKGSGIRLTFDGTQQTYLREVGDLVEFDGALPTQCELLDGPCVDLNLMVAKSLTNAAVWTDRVSEPRKLDSRGHDAVLMFVVSGRMQAGRAHVEPTLFEAWDLAVIRPDEDESLQLAPVDASAAPLVFFAALKDN
jgi:environmental stress-induced protein Ves